MDPSVGGVKVGMKRSPRSSSGMKEATPAVETKWKGVLRTIARRVSSLVEPRLEA